jgi:integrase/recombinase XerD
LISDAGIEKAGACHIYRHSLATHMLEHGADVRFVQAILGHAQLSTTAIYTHVAITQLKAVHAATHPTAKLLRTLDADPAAI